jgi:hypothetical protein
MSPLILQRASVARPSGQWRDDDYSVLENGVVVGRTFLLGAVSPPGRPWMWASGHNGDIKRAAHKNCAVGDIRQAQQGQDKQHIVVLLHVLHHFLKAHPEALPNQHPWSGLY